MKNYIIQNGMIILKDKVLEGYSLVVFEGRIKAITQNVDPYSEYEVVDAQGEYVAPGFVELHIHGCGVWSFENLKEGELAQVREYLFKRGVNTFLPTLQCCEEAIEKLALAMSADTSLTQSIPGCYVEGPFISPDKKGGILPQYIRKPERKYLEYIYKLSKGFIRIMTFAPELEESQKIYDFLCHNNIQPALGHSQCSVQGAQKFIDDRLLLITHLFNAMSQVSHKTPGLAMLPFIERDTFFELNGDGIHIDAACLKMCYETLNLDRCILVSDAVVSAGESYGTYLYYKKEVVSDKQGVRYKTEGTLIGSNLLIPQVIRNFREVTQCPLHVAVRLGTLIPCMLLGIAGQRGSIEVGKDADLVVVDRHLNCVRNLYE